MQTGTKVFGIGFQKTGTTTLGVIFEKLGYSMAGYHEFRDLAKTKDLTLQDLEERTLTLARDIQAAKDTPWPIFYRELDAAYPGSKFIHVTRDPQAWIRSAVNDFGTGHNALHLAIYGVPCPKGHEDIWLERYERHNAEVREYFADRPDDCLFLNLEEGISYEAVCDFLGEQRVGTGVPRANTRTKKRLKMLWWRGTAALAKRLARR